MAKILNPLGKLRAAGGLRSWELQQLWKERRVGRESGIFYALLAGRLIRTAEPFLAYDVVQEGLHLAPRLLRLHQLNLRLHRLLSLALAESGAPWSANQLLKETHARHPADSETLCLMGRTHKDLASLETDPRRRAIELKHALACYAKAFERDGSYYAAINAATVSLLLGRKQDAKKFADTALRACQRGLNQGQPDPWLHATAGEATLILQRQIEARRHYELAAALSANDHGVRSSMRKQARLILGILHRDTGELDSCFRMPSVIAFSGHMIDQPGRVRARFPERDAPAIRAEIDRVLTRTDARIGVASAACGSDLLFLSAVLERGGEVHVVLPCEPESFCRASVAWGRPQWRSLFHHVLKSASSVVYASEQPFPNDPVVFDYASRIIFGLARLRARVLQTKLELLAVWDGQPGDGPGGTAAAVECWRGAGETPTIIPVPGDARRGRSVLGRKPKTGVTRSAWVKPQAIKAILFADVVGYSHVDEITIPLYIKHFLHGVAGLLRRFHVPPRVQNTWGDALFMIFDSVRDAGLFAMELQQFTRAKAEIWKAAGLGSLQLRIGLHAGPVFEYPDPLLRTTSFTGTHVNRAARIEPIVEEGQIYVSEPFAALAAVDGVPEFTCDYVGEKPLAKKFGAARIYMLRRASDSGRPRGRRAARSVTR